MSTDLDEVRRQLDAYRCTRKLRRRHAMPTSYHRLATRHGATKDDAKALHRILSSVIDSDMGCWLWQGATTIGYGRVKIAGRVDMAHRVSYRLFVGPLKRGYCIDHQCHNRACVNPDHLEQVTYAVNMRRAHLVKDAVATLEAFERQDQAS